jgi:hypothetical protein
VSCALCEIRKEKRFCPAVHGRICPQCCGEQREVTLDCPSECVYLRQAREHERPRAADGADHNALFPAVEIGTRFLEDQQPLIMGLSYTLAEPARQDRGVKDSDLMAALAALAKTYETLVNAGLHYEKSLASLSQQAIVADLRKLIEEYRKEEEEHLGYSRLRDSEIFQALVFWLRMGHSMASGRPKSRAFIDFLLSQFPQKQSDIMAPDEAGGGIIVP